MKDDTMLDHVSNNGEWDTADRGESSMNEDKLLEILVRLERLDTGQTHVIERIAELSAGRQMDRSAIGQLEARVQKVEWKQADHEQRVRPWRELVFTVLASWLVPIGIYLFLHFTAAH